MEAVLFIFSVISLAAFIFTLTESRYLWNKCKRINDELYYSKSKTESLYNAWLKGDWASWSTVKTLIGTIDKMEARIFSLEKRVGNTPVPAPLPTLFDRISALESKKGKKSK